jgi:diguanylate cyclase (GGDEF)-like protein
MLLTRDERIQGLRRLAPFAAASLLAWVSLLFGGEPEWLPYATSVALLVLTGVLRGTRITKLRFGAIVPSLVYLAAVATLRNSGGGATSGVAAVSLIPVFFAAMYLPRLDQLLIVIAGLAVFYLAPVIIVGAPQYPSYQYRSGLLTVAVAAIIGMATRGLVRDVRRQARAAREREHMLERVNDVVRGLFASSDARADVCEAAREIGRASAAILYEPVPGSSMMRSTAISGLESDPIEISTREQSAVSEAFFSGQAQLIGEDVALHVGSRELWEQGGRPASVLYEPLLRGAEPIGVLVVAWPSGVHADGSRATVVKLLAHEAAGVIERADAISELTDMASTDPLTGLPNRRAWEESLALVLTAGESFTVAMLDFDNFKEFNDTYGHPAGDRLLKETAAIWREQLRAGDLLARLGGEEFGLLLIDCPTERATEVIERLRSLVYGERTCSAGFAAWRPGDSSESVMARADAALYEAKESGRDRVCMSV